MLRGSYIEAVQNSDCLTRSQDEFLPPLEMNIGDRSPQKSGRRCCHAGPGPVSSHQAMLRLSNEPGGSESAATGSRMSPCAVVRIRTTRLAMFQLNRLLPIPRTLPLPLPLPLPFLLPFLLLLPFSTQVSYFPGRLHCHSNP